MQMTKTVHALLPLPIAGLALALILSGAPVHGQAVDDTQLKQVIVFGRHSVRAPVADDSVLDNFSAQAFPSFPVAAGLLTPNGAALETILGGYYRLWLTKEGLLTGNDSADAAFTYFRANVLERTILTAQSLAAGMLPGATINVNFLGPQDNDPLFDPVGAGVSRLDARTAVAAVKGRLGGDPQSLASAYAPELALARSILFNYPAGETPVPAAPADKIDVTAIPIEITAGTSGAPVDIAGLMAVFGAVDPFIMEYADGLPAAEVGWGRLSAGGISQTARLYNLGIDLEYRTPYLAQVESSNVASHMVRSMVQAASGNAMAGALGNPSTKVIVLIASDVNVCGFAGLFHIDWLVPGYPTDYCSPGGAMVFQLRQSQSTGEYIVRASYVAQTPDQLRNKTALTLAAPPAIAPLFIPECSGGNATFDCPLADFVKVARHVVDPLSADLTN
jgi:4-phytase/acid phosphatase